MWTQHLLSLAIPTGLFLMERPRLPPRLVMHFDLRGNPTRMGSVDELWIMPGVMLFDIAMLLLVATLQRHFFRSTQLPELGMHAQGPALRYRMGELTIAMTHWIILSMNLAIASLWLAMSLGKLPEYGLLDDAGMPLFLGFMALCVVGVPVYYARRFNALHRHIAALVGTEHLQSRWRWGGTVYYNADDPRHWVPRRIGMGYTPNFAHTAAWLPLALLVGLPIVLGLAWILGKL